MKASNRILVLLLLLCLTGCSGRISETEPTVNLPSISQSEPGSTAEFTEPSAPGTEPTEALPTSEMQSAQTEENDPPAQTGQTDPSGQAPESTEPVTKPQQSTAAPSPETVPTVTDSSANREEGKLSYCSCGRYSGAFVEDGTDRPVENVAVILVTNNTNEYLTYASLNFEIDGVSATFVLTGLPAGASAWVLEYNALEISAGAQFVALESAMQFIPTEPWDELEVVLSDGLLSAKNLTDREYVDGYIYYKQLHTDGNYLGGITYRTGIGDLASGSTIEVTAGHARAEHCRVVRITQNSG